MRIGLITRCRNEPYVNEFVNHYLNEGVDTIHIIDDQSDYDLYKDVLRSPRVKVTRDIPFIGNSKGVGLTTLYRRIKKDFDWIVNVDMDEYITTKKNFNSTLREELLTTFREADCVKIPWVMMAFNAVEQNPGILLETNIYRWSHDLKHNSSSRYKKLRCRYDRIEVKCIFKTASFEKCWDHGPVYNNSKALVTVDGVYNQAAQLWSQRYPSDPFYENLRNKNIEEAHLLCFHYRFYSKQNCFEKISTSHFPDHTELDPKEVMAHDYPEVIDQTLSLKSQARPDNLKI